MRDRWTAAFLMNTSNWNRSGIQLNQNGQKEEPKEDHTSSQPGTSPKPTQGHDAPPDLDALWRQFNHRLTYLFRLRKGDLKGDSRPPTRHVQNRRRVVMAVIGNLTIAIWLGSGLYIVSPNQSGVVLQWGTYRYATLPGIRWHWPFPFQSHEFVDASTHTVEIGSNQAHGASRGLDALVLTRDGGLVDAHFALHYRITDIRAFLFNHASAHTSVVQAGEAAVREIFGALTLEDTLDPERIDLSSRLARKTQEILDLHRTGIFVTGGAIRTPQLRASVKRAIEEAAKAAQERARQKSKAIADAQHIQTQARLEAKQMMDEAERYKARMIATARGESERFKQVLAAYLQAPSVTRERMYLDAMQEMYTHSTKVLASGKAARQSFVLPLEKWLTQDRQPQKTKNTEEVKAPSTQSIQKKEMSTTENAPRQFREEFRHRDERSGTDAKE